MTNSVVGIANLFDAAGTDPEQMLVAVCALAHAELNDNHDYVLAFHTVTPRVHGLDRSFAMRFIAAISLGRLNVIFGASAAG